VIRLAAAVGMAVALALAVSSPAAASGSIRVAIVENARVVELRGVDIEITELGACLRCGRPRRAALVRATPSGDGVEVDGVRATAFRLRSDRPIRFNGREYPAPIDLARAGEGLAVINEVPLEDYLVGVLRAEAGEKWPLEALRAQAVVARTYAAYHRVLNATRLYHVVASTAHQQYAGRVPPASPIWGAVRETAGQVLLWEGDVFPAFYHTESGGYTEDPRTVFAARNMPGLKPVRCDFSTGSPHYYWSLDVRLVDLAETLRRHDVGVGSVTAIEVTERTSSLRAAGITVHGTRGSVRLRGNDFRRMLGYDTFKSTLFAVAVDAQYARFSGRGYGHGVGMCQWGAKGMAEQGHTAKQILEFYYPGATLSTLDLLTR
jgi:stage II sporulation protein D